MHVFVIRKCMIIPATYLFKLQGHVGLDGRVKMVEHVDFLLLVIAPNLIQDVDVRQVSVYMYPENIFTKIEFP